MLKIKALLVSIFVLYLITGCTYKNAGLTQEESKKEKTIMVANMDMECNLDGTIFSILVKVGDMFSIESLKDNEYKYVSGTTLNPFSGYVTMSELVSNSVQKFPKDALFLETETGRPFITGFLVYPNGKFVYEDYNMVTYRSEYGWVMFDTMKCNNDGKVPFTMKRND